MNIKEGNWHEISMNYLQPENNMPPFKTRSAIQTIISSRFSLRLFNYKI